MCTAFPRRWIVFLLLITAPIPAVALDGILRIRPEVRSAVRWFEALNLDSPALWPSGTSLRHPGTIPPELDLRFSPWLPLAPDGRSAIAQRGRPGR